MIILYRTCFASIGTRPTQRLSFDYFSYRVSQMQFQNTVMIIQCSNRKQEICRPPRLASSKQACNRVPMESNKPREASSVSAPTSHNSSTSFGNEIETLQRNPAKTTQRRTLASLHPSLLLLLYDDSGCLHQAVRLKRACSEMKSRPFRTMRLLQTGRRPVLFPSSCSPLDGSRVNPIWTQELFLPNS